MNHQYLAVGIILFLFTHESSFCQPGTLDPTFNGDGKLSTLYKPNSAVYSLVVQPDGKLVVAGFAGNDTDQDFALLRYQADGTLDSSFSTDGKLTTQVGAGRSTAYSLVMQNDGKLIAAGYCENGNQFNFAAARYNSEGTLDSSFSNDGIVTTSIGGSYDGARSILLQPDGKMVVACYSFSGASSNFALVRYNTDGTLDTSFGINGMVTTVVGPGLYSGATSGVLLSNGNILIAGYADSGSHTDFALTRYLPDGTLDSTFGSNGMVITVISPDYDTPFGIALQSNEEIVVAGISGHTASYVMALAKYHLDGTLDTSFDADGILTTSIGNTDDQANALLIQPDDKIMIAGTSWDFDSYKFAMMRFNEDGIIDSSFSDDGIVTTDVEAYSDMIYAIAFQADGKIVVAGKSYYAGDNSEIALARYFSDIGTLVSDATTPAENPLIIYPNPLSSSATMSFPIKKSSKVIIELFDMEGRKLQTLLNQNEEAGTHTVDLDRGRLPVGLYVLKMKTPSSVVTQSIIIQ